MQSERSPSPHRERPLPGHGAAAEGERTPDSAPPRTAGSVGVAPYSTPRQSSRCAAQVVEGEAVLLDLQGRQLVGLNSVGSFVFGLIDGAHDLASLSAAVAQRFEVELRQAELDVVAFVEDLQRRGFVEVAEP
jgi:hypothetical protein